MAFIKTTAPRDATGETRAMYARQQAAYGYVPNYAKVFCHRPEVMKLWSDLLYGIRRHLDRRRLELVTLAAAHEVRSSYCSLAHGRALTEFCSADEVRSIVSDPDRAPVAPAERAIIKLARQVARDASAVTAADVDAVKAHGITDAEVFDIVAVAAGRAFFTKVIEGLGAEADTVFLEMDEALRESLTVGRPIGLQPLERLSDEAA